jgi:hypothetical protein
LSFTSEREVRGFTATTSPNNSSESDQRTVASDQPDGLKADS